ncbi:SpoIIE family protein phosphatase [Candidatus Poribacteria bacterium]|nr:SpoIIE family protein phosphatase [Candidatus Poribacteria bacterium]
MNRNSTALQNAKILIVDDIPENLNVLSQALETEGYKIVAAPGGAIALQLATRTQPDLILLDIMMPEMDGFETCRRLKADASTADIPVIFITARDEMSSLVKGFEVGGVDYIQKPFRHEEVCARVKTHLTIKQLDDELRKANDALEKALNQLIVDNVRKTEELENARVIQQGFLPPSVPELSFLEIAPFQKAATEVGGDYYDFFLKPCEGSEPSQGFAVPSKLLVAIGDATGHGVGAALMVSATKMALMMNDEPNLEKKTCQINTYLKRINRSHRLNMALCLVEMSYDGDSRAVTVKAAGGGMPPLYVLRANGSIEEITVEGLPLGAMETAKYRATQFQMNPSDLLVLMSDGLPERQNDSGEMLGYAEITARIQTIGQTEKNAQEVLEALIRESDAWSNDTSQNDDVTLVVLKVKSNGR